MEYSPILANVKRDFSPPFLTIIATLGTYKLMKLPDVLTTTYRSDHKLDSFVSNALAAIEGHITSNTLVFFPEYTEHGLPHLELTLQTAVDLVTLPARELLSGVDAATLIVAVGLHDLGMYLTRDGFESLISRNSRWKGVPHFDKLSWAELWEDFYSDATRFDGRKLRSLFGNNYRPVRQLPAKGNPWNEFDFLLVGEFLRKHHPRLAHEIAIYGLPAKNGETKLVCLSDTEDQRFLSDISGLIARSHGIDLRSCIDYLEVQYRNKIDPRRAHAIFIAVLLRIADYFQLQATRAPTERTEVTSFRSSFSACEWRVHQSVSDIHNSGDDPEAIVVDAAPPDVESFLRLKTWLNGLQSEMDRSWAILGEVFGLQTHLKLDKLALKIRRVRSNLDDVDSFAKTVSYIPAKIAFEAANTDLLKLLVAPLYGDDPGIGLRELFQNAIDAVREFEDLAMQNPELSKVDRYIQDADVVLQVECDEDRNPLEITVTDRGVGMTPQTVREYFLRAGASFRKSNVWRQEHEDTEGHSRVLRSGRFGVGALAAFLLGDEIHVTTRHAQSLPSEGVKFSARLDDETISIGRASCPVGTQIRIKVPETYRQKVSAIVPYEGSDKIHFGAEDGHYFLQKPSLRRRFSCQQTELKPVSWLPLLEDSNSIEWRCFSTQHFEKIFWTYSGQYPSLSCNGIVVSQNEGLNNLSEQISAPRLSVFDKDGYLPLNLQRTGLQTRDVPFAEDLLRDVIDDLVAHTIATAPDTHEHSWLDGIYQGFRRSSYYSYLYNSSEWARWTLTPNGYILNDLHLLKAFAPRYVVIGIGGNRGYVGWGDQIAKAVPANTILTSYLPHGLSDFNNRIKGLFQSVLQGSFFPSHLMFKPLQAFIPGSVIAKVKKNLRPGRDVQRKIAEAETLPSRNGWRWIKGFEGASSLDISTQVTKLKVDHANPLMLLTGEIVGWNLDDNDEVICAQWLKNFRSPEFPIAPKARKEAASGVSSHTQELVQLWRKAQRRKKDEQASD